jgi:hypothetical protein
LPSVTTFRSARTAQTPIVFVFATITALRLVVDRVSGRFVVSNDSCFASWHFHALKTERNEFRVDWTGSDRFVNRRIPMWVVKRRSTNPNFLQTSLHVVTHDATASSHSKIAENSTAIRASPAIRVSVSIH